MWDAQKRSTRVGMSAAAAGETSQQSGIYLCDIYAHLLNTRIASGMTLISQPRR